MNNLNRLIIMGNVVRDAELKNVSVNGVDTPRCKFSVAVNETRTTGESITTYFDVTLWRGPASKLAKWLYKGRPVLVEGHVRLNQYVDSNHVVRTSMQIHSATVTLIGKKPEDVPEDAPEEELDDDELPFG